MFRSSRCRVRGEGNEAGIASNSTILDSVVLFYAPEVGYTGPDGSVFDPKTAELVVLVNSGPKQ